MSASKQVIKKKMTKCFICNGKLENACTLKIVYCCKREVHQNCWFTKMKINKDKCCVCKQLYSKVVQMKIQHNIKEKIKFERNRINQIFKYMHKEFFKRNKC